MYIILVIIRLKVKLTGTFFGNVLNAFLGFTAADLGQSYKMNLKIGCL